MAGSNRYRFRAFGQLFCIHCRRSPEEISFGTDRNKIHNAKRTLHNHESEMQILKEVIGTPQPTYLLHDYLAFSLLLLSPTGRTVSDEIEHFRFVLSCIPQFRLRRSTCHVWKELFKHWMLMGALQGSIDADLDRRKPPTAEAETRTTDPKNGRVCGAT